MWKIIVFAILLIGCIILTLFLIANCFILIIKVLSHTNKINTIINIKKVGITLVTGIIICSLFVIYSQWSTFTPKIEGFNSISELKQIELNGRKEWISIRGENIQSPVLLFLAGGPGGTQIASVRYELAELEKYFVVVNWDQHSTSCS